MTNLNNEPIKDKNENENIGKRLWVKFVGDVQKIFGNKEIYIYPPKEQIDEIIELYKKIKKDPNTEKIEAFQDLLEQNYFSIVNPKVYLISMNDDKHFYCEETIIEKNEISAFLKKKKLKKLLPIVDSINSSKIKIKLNVKDKLCQWDENDPDLVYNLSEPCVLVDGINKLKTKLENISLESKKKGKKRLKYWKTAKSLYKGLKELEARAKLLELALGTPTEDNFFVIERKRTGGIWTKILRAVGLVKQDNYQNINEENGSKEFTLSNLFGKSKKYRMMLRAYIDSANISDSDSTVNSLKRKLFRIQILLKKWIESYTVKPTSVDAQEGGINLMLKTEISKFLKFEKPKSKDQKKYENGEKINCEILAKNKTNIKNFLKDWSHIKLTKTYVHELKNTKLPKAMEDFTGFVKNMAEGI